MQTRRTTRSRGHAAAQRLVKRMEANAFLEALYNANYERLYIYAENLLFNAAYAEEAVQETFFEAVRKQDALMRHAKPEDYRLLCRITLEGATHLEVAKELGISVWSSQKRLQRIRKKLCKQLLPNKSKKISENMSVLRF